MLNSKGVCVKRTERPKALCPAGSRLENGTCVPRKEKITPAKRCREGVEVGFGTGAFAGAGDIAERVDASTDEQGDDAEDEHDLDEGEAAGVAA